jgi:hypothetical protein
MPEDSIGKVWDRPRPLTYAIANLPSKGDLAGKQADVASAVARACGMWAAVSEFDFAPVRGGATPDLEFRFGTTSGSSTFRFHAGECAPPVKGTVTITFNDNISWTSPETYSVWLSVVFGGVVHLFELGSVMDLGTVAAHEVGHALGVGHDTTHRESVMQPDTTLLASPGVAVLTGRRLPTCDAEALATVWGTSIEGWQPMQPIAGGMVVVGGRMEVTNPKSSSIAKPLPTCSWGDPGTMRQMVAGGYCWNDFTNSGGYGYLYRNLAQTSYVRSVPDVPTLVGGYLEYTNEPSTSAMVRDGRWGVQADQGQLLGKFYAWNPHLGARGHVYAYGVTGQAFTDAGDYALLVHGGRTQMSSRTDMSNPQTVQPWGDPAKGTLITLTPAVAWDPHTSPAWTTSQLAVE